MQITAQMVKELREKTGAGMMKCKDALKECNGNFEEAVDFLRKKGLASAGKRAGRATSEGLIVPVATEDRRIAAIVELNCETDFVARNDQFVDITNKLAKFVLENAAIKNTADLLKATFEGQTVEEYIKSIIATMGENITLGRVERFEIADGKFGIFDAYVHGDGNIGVLVHIDAENEAAQGSADTLAYAHEVALQTAAMKPLYLNSEKVPTEILAREKDVILGQIKNDPKNANKPEEIMNKIVDGRLNKYFKENCLVSQAYVKDDNMTIDELAGEYSKKAGGKISVANFRRWALGEAIEEETPEENASEAAG